MPITTNQRPNCVNCKIEIPRTAYKYCSNKCQQDYFYKRYINQWLDGNVSGLQGHGVVSRYVKRYLREKFANKCCLCGWAKVNIITGQVPLVADHIDGNWMNNTDSNLRLICPNCDSLSATYAGLNRGKGRRQRALSKRSQEIRLQIVNMPE